jgi:hypothetical protein
LNALLPLVLLWGLTATTAQAAGPLKGLPIKQDTSTLRYASDLVGSDAPNRLYAVRVLRRRVRTAWRLAVKDGSDMHLLEARQTLSEFDSLVAPRCIRQLDVPATLRPCAQILGMLETSAALPSLRKQLAQPNGWSTRRAIDKAIRRIEAAQ